MARGGKGMGSIQTIYMRKMRETPARPDLVYIVQQSLKVALESDPFLAWSGCLNVFRNTVSTGSRSRTPTLIIFTRRG